MYIYFFVYFVQSKSVIYLNIKDIAHFANHLKSMKNPCENILSEQTVDC